MEQSAWKTGSIFKSGKILASVYITLTPDTLTKFHRKGGTIARIILLCVLMGFFLCVCGGWGVIKCIHSLEATLLAYCVTTYSSYLINYIGVTVILSI